MGQILLERSRHQGPEELQLTVSQTNAAGSLGMVFAPERTAHQCVSTPLRDPTGQRFGAEANRAWKSLPINKGVPHNKKVLPLTKIQPLLITKGDLSTGEIPLVTKTMFAVPFSFFFSFFYHKRNDLTNYCLFDQREKGAGTKTRENFLVLIKSANRWRNRRRRGRCR